MYGYVGIIMLIGIVKKNAIMMIDFAIAGEHEHQLAPADAIMRAASVRFRPIMMTTVSAIVGTLPIAIGIGASAASRRPLGVTVVGGLVFSQSRDAVRDAGVLYVSRRFPDVVRRRRKAHGRDGRSAAARRGGRVRVGRGELALFSDQRPNRQWISRHCSSSVPS